jgi:tetratricopeptide (TPR) repeat protein
MTSSPPHVGYRTSTISDVAKSDRSVNKVYLSVKAGGWSHLLGFIVLIALMLSATAPLFTQQTSAQQISKGGLRGTVQDSAGKPVAGALVRLEQKGGADAQERKTGSQGEFVFTPLKAGTYAVSAEKSGFRSLVTTVIAASPDDPKKVLLVLDLNGAAHPASQAASAMEFADQPNFTVAGVTDWTAAGGHGSDTRLRTSETLARETIVLKPDTPGHDPAGANNSVVSESTLREAVAKAPRSFDANHQLGEFYLRSQRYSESIPPLLAAYQIDPGNYGNQYHLAFAYKETGNFTQAREHVTKMLAHNETADLHRLLGDIDESMGDPLSAVHEYEQAARIDPSEQNYFAWGSELLLHRAVRPAVEVFGKGTEAYPKSSRMLAALGAALFASGFYDEAALRLCNASDLNPADTSPYIFLGKIGIAAPTPLPCVEQKLARFVQQYPGDPLANYYYAMAIKKRLGPSDDQAAFLEVENLFNKAITIDPKCGDAYLQLGILYFAQRKFQPAIDAYKKAIDANSQLTEAYYRLGVAYDRTGEPEKARQEFQLHDEIEKTQAANVERQRKEIRQFSVVTGQPTTPSNQ